ncbi:peptidoglycan-binding protein [Burkholderia sp. L27(2015)]|uniref:peptidoglycan-binding domain-containing protein n=1 Tax=Burkholderia sp. L27(2015) TaxID=1641858 RepID=UPI00131A7C8C|nr:peptidoglycan-binding domain-containing protein [Burkholderia sp. L27(2015)]
MKIGRISFIALASILLLDACATTPMGPTVQVMPGATIPFPIFQQDQDSCKQYAQSQVAGQADSANKTAVGTAVLGTVLGAALGGAVGQGQGAAVGSAAGAIAGTGLGTGTSQSAQLSIQDQYNNAYVQCMYSKGNQVPGAAAPQAVAPPPPQPMTLMQAQAKLNSLGYPAGTADGAMGNRTHLALKHFQRDHGIGQTGELDGNTAAALSN